MTTVNIKKQAFINDPIENVKLGFELETQETEDKTKNDLLDQESYDDAVSEHADDLMSDYEWLGNTISNSIDWSEVLKDKNLEEVLTERAYDRTRDSAHSSACDRVNESDYKTEICDMFPELTYDHPLEVDEDASVEGFEIRTKGGLDLDEFLGAADTVFGLKHKIDTRCSFHIHLSIPGIEHQYGKQFQAALYESLLNQWEFIPLSVKKRLANSEMRNKYFAFKLSQDKMRAVQKHSQGTWEFRLFGNVTNAEDAEVCALIAIEAMRFAYQVQLKQITKTMDSESDFEMKLNQLISATRLSTQSYQEVESEAA